MQLENLFDRLPDEVVSRVFTAGCDMHDPWDNRWRLEGELQYQEYEFNAAMRRTCKRFYQISRESGNRHLWFRNINLDLNLRDWGDMSVEFTQYCHMLISARSRGCDIHVWIVPPRDYNELGV